MNTVYGIESEVEVRDLDDVTKEIAVRVAPQEVTKRYESKLKRAMQHVRINGFRPGKAPRAMVVKMYGTEIESDVVGDVVQELMTKIVEQDKIELVSRPDLNITPLAEDKSLSFTAKLTVAPKPVISNYNAFDITATKLEVKDEDIDDLINKFGEKLGTLQVPADRSAAQIKDNCDLTVKITVKGEEDPESKAEPTEIELGEGSLPKEIEDELVGKEAGYSFSKELVVPESYPAKSLRGKEATFEVTLVKIQERIKLELTDETASRFMPECATADEARVKIREALTERAEDSSNDEIIGKIFEQIVERNTFTVPQAMVDNEIRAMLIEQRVVDPKKVDIRQVPMDRFRDFMGERALKRVQLRTIVDRIAEQENINHSEEDFEARLEKIAKSVGMSVEDVRPLYEREENAEDLKDELRRDAVLKFLKDRANITYVEPQKGEQTADSEVSA